MDEDSHVSEQTVVPVIEEDLVTGTRAVKTGSIRIRKQVQRIRKDVVAPLLRDVSTVSRVPVNRVVDTIPEVREEGDTLIVPVVEEELVIEKRLVLKEEIHIRRERSNEEVTRSIIVGREHATVERLDADGNIIDA